MGLFSWFFPKKKRIPLFGSKKYEYATGNIETAIRIERGEYLMSVIADIKPRWTPGNEHLWDEYDPESLLDTSEKRQHLVNRYLFGRLTIYRALLTIGRDVRGKDPLEFKDQVPEVMTQLRKRFPGIFDGGPSPSVKLEALPLKLTPGDPGPITSDTPEQKP